MRSVLPHPFRFVAILVLSSCGGSSAQTIGSPDGALDGGSSDGSSADPDGPVDPADAGAADGHADAPFTGTGRDWSKYPAIVEQASFTTLYALSDMHGNYDDLWNLLAKAAVIPGQPASPTAAVWTGGSATLVITGDMIDKGTRAPDVVDFVRALEIAASNGGGRVIVSLGNHEAEFLVDPMNSKATAADGIDPELSALGISPATYASAMDAHGMWLRERPFGVRVEKWFFSHAGDTGGKTVAQLEAALRAAVDDYAFNDPAVVGTSSILESKDWYTADPTMGGRYALAVGAAHIVFGHNPNALGVSGAMGVDAQKTLFKIDCGVAAGASNGGILRITHVGGNEVAEEITSSGAVMALYTGP